MKGRDAYSREPLILWLAILKMLFFSIFHKLIIIVLRITVLREQEDNNKNTFFFPTMLICGDRLMRASTVEIGYLPVNDTQAVLNGLVLYLVLHV